MPEVRITADLVKRNDRNLRYRRIVVAALLVLMVVTLVPTVSWVVVPPDVRVVSVIMLGGSAFSLLVVFFSFSEGSILLSVTNSERLRLYLYYLVQSLGDYAATKDYSLRRAPRRRARALLLQINGLLAPPEKRRTAEYGYHQDMFVKDYNDFTSDMRELMGYLNHILKTWHSGLGKSHVKVLKDILDNAERDMTSYHENLRHYIQILTRQLRQIEGVNLDPRFGYDPFHWAKVHMGGFVRGFSYWPLTLLILAGFALGYWASIQSVPLELDDNTRLTVFAMLFVGLATALLLLRPKS